MFIGNRHYFIRSLSSRHEKPSDPDDPLSTQNIRDRFYGINDPVAEKLLSRYKESPQLEAPEDKTVTTLYIGNVIDIDEQQLRFVEFDWL